MKTMASIVCVMAGWALLGGGCGLGQPATTAPATRAGTPPGYFVYVGTYTGAKSKGIYLSRFDLGTGKLSHPELVAETANPTFLAVHPNQRFLYAANEVGEFEGQRSGIVTAYGIDPRTGRLTLLNRASSGGPGPCHLVVDASGQCVVVANYGGGSTAALGLEADGRVRPPGSVIQHRGSSVNRQRQEGPHAHGVTLDAANHLAFITDLGLDQVLAYRLDPAKATLTAHEPPHVAVKPGAGPRHFTFHPQGRFAYVINELNSTLTAFTYDPASGALRERQTLSTLPANFTGGNSTAEVEVHPSGKFLYGSNRGHDSLAVFAIDPSQGTLTLVEHQSTQGRTPRNFALEPTGAFLFAANQGSDSLVVFRIDPTTGHLSPTGQRLEVGAPVCVKFVPLSP